MGTLRLCTVTIVMLFLNGLPRSLFTLGYHGNITDEERIGQKRRKKLQHFSSFFSDGPGGAGMGGGFFKGGAGLLAGKGLNYKALFCGCSILWVGG